MTLTPRTWYRSRLESEAMPYLIAGWRCVNRSWVMSCGEWSLLLEFVGDEPPEVRG